MRASQCSIRIRLYIVRLTLKIKFLLREPNAPTPWITRPTMNAFMFGAAPQMTLPTSKMTTMDRKSHFTLKTPYALPLWTALAFVSDQELRKGVCSLLLQGQNRDSTHSKGYTDPWQFFDLAESRDNSRLNVRNLLKISHVSLQMTIPGVLINLQWCHREHKEALSRQVTSRPRTTAENGQFRKAPSPLQVTNLEAANGSLWITILILGLGASLYV